MQLSKLWTGNMRVPLHQSTDSNMGLPIKQITDSNMGITSLLKYKHQHELVGADLTVA